MQMLVLVSQFERLFQLSDPLITEDNSLPNEDASSMLDRPTTKWPGKAGCWPVISSNGYTPVSR